MTNMDFLVKELRQVNLSENRYGFFDVAQFEQPYNARQYAEVLMKAHKKKSNSPYKVVCIYTGKTNNTFTEGEIFYQLELNFDNIEVV